MNLQESWHITRRHLLSGRAMLHESVMDNPDGGSAKRFEEWLEHNELELALDELIGLGRMNPVPDGFWQELSTAARNMGLAAKARKCDCEMGAFPLTVQWQSDSDEAKVQTLDELDRLLEKIASEADSDRPPAVLVTRPAGQRGMIVLCLPESSVSVWSPEGSNSWTTIGDASADGTFAFWYLGHHTEALNKHALPAEAALHLLHEFVLAGGLSPQAVWDID